MPIHDQSYRHYSGHRAPVGRSWTVIAQAGIMNMIRKRAFLGLLLSAWVPFIVHAVMVYFAVNVPAATALLSLDAKMYRQFFQWQDFFVFVITVYVGAGLIANDRRANALQIYLAKPLLRSEYIAGKAAVLFIFIMAVTWLPAMLLLFLQVMFRGTLTSLSTDLALIPSITVASLLQALVATFTMLALSSLSKSSRYVAILYTGIIFFTASIFGVMSAITGSTSVSWVSVGASLEQVTDVIFRQPPSYTTPWQVSLIVLAGLLAVSISVLERRVRGVEIVT